MKYLCLVYQDESVIASIPRNEFNDLLQQTIEFRDEMVQSGQLLGGSPLQAPETATTVRIRGGKLMMTDGPFAETKEQVGGYLMLEAAATGLLVSGWPEVFCLAEDAEFADVIGVVIGNDEDLAQHRVLVRTGDGAEQIK